jgi:GntR family transcriptional regulator
MLPEFGKRMTMTQLTRFPIFRILREDFGLVLRDVDIELEAVTAPLEVTRVLQIEPLSPVMLFNGALFLADARLVHVTQIYYRGDRFQFRFNMDLREEAKQTSRRRSRKG